MFDTFIDHWNSPRTSHRSGILVLKVSTKSNEDLNQKQRFITVLGPERLLEVGEFVEGKL